MARDESGQKDTGECPARELSGLIGPQLVRRFWSSAGTIRVAYALRQQNRTRARDPFRPHL
jgi:hypothetical protein